MDSKVMEIPGYMLVRFNRSEFGENEIGLHYQKEGTMDEEHPVRACVSLDQEEGDKVYKGKIYKVLKQNAEGEDEIEEWFSGLMFDPVNNLAKNVEEFTELNKNGKQ